MSPPTSYPVSPPPPPLFPLAGFDAVVIAASLGGREAIEQVVHGLPFDFPAPILVAQHVGPHSPNYIPELVARRARVAAKSAEAGERLRPGTIYFAPPGRHLLVTAEGRCVHSDGPRVSFARPSADVLFASAAAAFGTRVLCVVLTGRLYDGAAGAAAIRRAGGVVLAQDPATCRAPEMPRAAIRQGAVHLTLPLAALTAALVSLVSVPGAPALFGLGRSSAA